MMPINMVWLSNFGLKIVTMDRDFEKVKDVEVEFLQDVVFN